MMPSMGRGSGAISLELEDVTVPWKGCPRHVLQGASTWPGRTVSICQLDSPSKRWHVGPTRATISALLTLASLILASSPQFQLLPIPCSSQQLLLCLHYYAEQRSWWGFLVLFCFLPLIAHLPEGIFTRQISPLGNCILTS